MTITRKDQNQNVELANLIPLDLLLKMQFSEGKTLKEMMLALESKMQNCNVISLSPDKSNNKNFLVEKKDGSASIVVQLMKIPLSAHQAILELAASKKPEWLAISYGRKSSKDDFEKDVINFATSVEKCQASLVKAAADLHAESIGFPSITRKAADWGMQISNMLHDVSEKNIIWPDMKPGNILLRQEGGIVITDIKTFCPVNMIPMRKIDDNNSIVDYAKLSLTEAYLSRHFIDNLSQNKHIAPKHILPIEEIKKTWEKEYSYQLGVILHLAISNQSVFTGNNKADDVKFDFTRPIFKTEEGQRMQSVIEKLTHEDADKRINHREAARLLSVIQDKKMYDELNEKLNKSLKKSTTSKIFEKIKGLKKPSSDALVSKKDSQIKSPTPPPSPQSERKVTFNKEEESKLKDKEDGNSSLKSPRMGTK